MWVTESHHCQPCTRDDSGYSGDKMSLHWLNKTSPAVVVNQHTAKHNFILVRSSTTAFRLYAATAAATTNKYTSKSRTLLLKEQWHIVFIGFNFTVVFLFHLPCLIFGFLFLFSQSQGWECFYNPTLPQYQPGFQAFTSKLHTALTKSRECRLCLIFMWNVIR